MHEKRDILYAQGVMESSRFHDTCSLCDYEDDDGSGGDNDDELHE